MASFYNQHCCAEAFDAGRSTVIRHRGSEVVMTRRLIVAGRRGQPPRECSMEIEFNPAHASANRTPAVAAVRVSPFGDWFSVEGEDLIQALELAIRMAKSEAEAWGADWPDED